LRSLSRAGIPVHAVHTQQKAQRFSHHLASFHLIGPNAEEQLAHLERFGREVGGMIVPTNDDYVALVSKNRARLARHFIVPLPDWEIVGPMIDRVSAYTAAASIGIKVPRHWSPDTASEWRATVASLVPQDCDYILKTRSVLSAPADAEALRQSKVAPRRRDEILIAGEEMRRRTGHYPLIQEVIPGAADSAIGVSMIVSSRGEFVLAYCVRRLRLATYKLDAGYVHPYELGSVVWCETVHDDEALEAARALVTLFRYTGQITVEFRRDTRDGSLHLMKIEPRPVRATSLSTAIGMDIPTALHETFTGGSPRVAAEYPDGVGWLYLQGYASSLFRNKHGNRRDMLRVLRGSRRIKALAEDLSDPVPLIVGVARVAARPPVRFIRRLMGRQTGLAPVPP
jgi:predicted ATP-grasp superfamily ATP-dependent carboligase